MPVNYIYKYLLPLGVESLVGAAEGGTFAGSASAERSNCRLALDGRHWAFQEVSPFSKIVVIRGTRSARARLRLVHRGLRYRRSERGEDSPDGARLSRFVGTIEIAAVDDPNERCGG